MRSVQIHNLFLCISVTLYVPSVSAQPHQTERGASIESAPLPQRLYVNVHALCIGINQYKSSGISALKWAEKDATELSDVLKTRFGYVVRTLIGAAARRTAILETLERYQSMLGPDDALIVFFAGHGQTVELESHGRAGFLIPFDADLDLTDTRNVDEWKDAAISMHELGECVQQMKARHVLILADACYSGFLGKRSGHDQRVDLRELMGRPSRMVITAGTEDQAAFEIESLQHGIFTHVLLEELRKDYPVSATEVFTSLRRGVAAISSAKMLPQLREVVTDNGEFVFLPKAVPDAEVGTAIADANQRINRRTARRTTHEDVLMCFQAGRFETAVDAAGQQREWEGRFKRFEDNASIGDGVAMAALYYCYAKGLGTTADLSLASQWARRAFDSEDPLGLHVLAECYLNGHGVARNLVEADRLLEQSAKGGVRLSQLVLAAQRISEGSAEERRSAFDSLVELSQSSDFSADAGLWLGRAWLGSIDVPGVVTDYDKAIQYLENAATRYESVAAFDLYDASIKQYFAEFFSGTEPNESLRHKAAQWLRRAAEAGNGRAQGVLANELMQHSGDVNAHTYHDYFPRPQLGLERDLREAYKWADLASVNGDPLGQVIAARLLVEGVGTNENPAKAYEFLQSAVNQRSGIGFAHAGIWTVRGTAGIPRDNRRGLAEFQKAAALGPEFKFILSRWYWRFYKVFPNGTLSEFGSPFPLVRDDREAIQWGNDAISLCRDAAHAGNLDAAAFLLLQLDFGYFGGEFDIFWPELDAALVDPNHVFRVARHLELSHLPLSPGNAPTNLFSKDIDVDAGESEIMIDAPQYAWFALWLYERAALDGQPDAVRMLEGDRADWWFRRAQRYESFKMLTEAYWCLDLASAYGHQRAIDSKVRFRKDYATVVLLYTKNGIRDRWQLRNMQLASELHDLGLPNSGITSIWNHRSHHMIHHFDELADPTSDKRKQADHWAKVRDVRLAAK